MFGLTKNVDSPMPFATFDEQELKNLKEQKEIVENAMRTQLMLTGAYNITFKALAAKYHLPTEFEVEWETGNIFVKEPADG